MNQAFPPVEVKVWAEYACFTRPEMKVERVTYPVPTPTAARGVLEAIFWKPEFRWQIEEIWVLNDIRYASILRNEVNTRASERAAAGWHKGGGIGGYVATADRSQRHTLALYDVAYVLRAQPVLKPGVEADVAKYRDQFRRRVRDGRCFAMPFLGCREFSASFAEPDGNERPIKRSEEIGSMLLDLQYEAGNGGRATPRFFQATLADGILRVPPLQREEA